MTSWYSKNLGDAMLAWSTLGQIEHAFRSAHESAGYPSDMALYSRHDSEGRLQCEVIVYLSPACAELARKVGARSCVKPPASGLGLVAGGDKSAGNFFIGQLGLLARAWWKLVKRDCPADWTELLPDLDFGRPDRSLEPQALPVLEFLPRLAAQARPSCRQVIDRLIEAKSSLRFGQTYTETDFGAEFLRQYGWIKILGPDAYWRSDRLASGFLFLGDDVTYPPHWHAAEEVYLPISGEAEWYREDRGWQKQSAGSLIYHASDVKHATRTLGEPMMALYLWRGDDLNQKSDIQ